MVFSRRDDQHPHPYPLPQPSGRGAFGKEAGGVHGSSTNPARMKMGAAASMARDVGTNRLFVILRRLAQDDEFVAWVLESPSHSRGFGPCRTEHSLSESALAEDSGVCLLRC